MNDERNEMFKGDNKNLNNVNNIKNLQNSPTNMKKYAGNGMRLMGGTAKMAGVGMKAAGTGIDTAGKGIRGVGNALNSTGIGALLGVPLSALGAITSGIGKGTKLAGSGVKGVGDATKEIGSKVSSSSDKSGEVILKKTFKIGLKAIMGILSIIMSIFGVVMLFIVVICIPIFLVIGIIDSISGSSSGDSIGISYSPNTYLQQVSDECDTIIVDTHAYSLEDYVKGVVSDEAYTNEGMEALKAQAIAARTYAIVRTNYCTKSISNSSVDQNFTSNFVDAAVEATEATKGLVLTYNSEVFLSEYDSFFNEGDYSCDSSGCSVTYTKQPNNETHVVTVDNSYVGYIAGGHGRGMSQVASYQMARDGKTFDYILYHFYSSGVTISSLDGSGGYTSGQSAEKTGFTVRTTAPNENNEHDKTFWFSNENVSYAGGYVGQCTWYAVGRVNEILSAVNSDLRLRWAPHAKLWYQTNIDQSANAFSYSPNVNEPKVGAIIVWGSEQFGHVAVVEAVNDDGTIDYSEGNVGNENPYGFRYVKGVSYTKTGVGTISSIWSGYNFIGYIYTIE